MIPNQSENITPSQGQAEDFVSRNEEDGINIQRLLGGIISFRPFYLVSVILFVSAAYLVNRYADRIYEGTIILNIETDGSSAGAGVEALMTQIGYYNPRLTFENELVQMQSIGLMEKTLTKLDFGIQLTSQGRVRNSEIYGNEGLFRVVLDSSHIQDVGFNFKIDVVDDQRFRLIVEGESRPKWFGEDQREEKNHPVAGLSEEFENLRS